MDYARKYKYQYPVSERNPSLQIDTNLRNKIDSSAKFSLAVSAVVLALGFGLSIKEKDPDYIFGGTAAATITGAPALAVITASRSSRQDTLDSD